MARRTKPRVGRPPKGPEKLQPITVRLGRNARVAIDRLRGKQPPADWVREAAEQRIERETSELAESEPAIPSVTARCKSKIDTRDGRG